MEEIISKEELENFKNLKGQVRGVAFRTELEFILKEQGEEGLKKIEEAMEFYGYPIKYREVKIMEFYPLGMLAVSQVLITKILNLTDEKIMEMGRLESKVSLIIKLFMRFFVSLDMVVKEVPKMWRKYYTTGELKVTEYKKEEKYAVLRLENFKVHFIHCKDLVGYFSAVLEMIVGKKVSCEETKCQIRGDGYHEFLLKW